MENNNTKICPHCKINKEITDFHFRKKGVESYRQSWCSKCIQEAGKKWVVKNRKHSNKKQREYYLKNIDKLREYYRNRSKLFPQKKYKNEVISGYGGKCNCCGETNIIFLTVDHVNNDGAEQRRFNRSESGNSLYRKIVKNNFPAEYQILCYNCNIGKYHNKGVCPHTFNEAVEELLYYK